MNANYSRVQKIEILVQLISIVLKKASRALVIRGPAGIGKSTAVAAAIAQAGFGNDEYVYAATQMSPLEFYCFIYRNHDKLIVLDDSSGGLGHPIIQAMIKNMLWPNPVTKQCNVSWSTKTSILKNEDVEKSFNFMGEIIHITNQGGLGNRANAKAVNSRVLSHYYDLSFEERKDFMQEISLNHDEFGLTAEAMKELVSFILQHVTPATVDFDLRMLIKFAPLVQVYEESDVWKKLVAALLVVDPRYILIKKILEMQEKEGFDSEEEVRRYSFAMEDGGLKGASRSTYFELKAKWFQGYMRQSINPDDRNNGTANSVSKRGKGRPRKNSENQSRNPALSSDANANATKLIHPPSTDERSSNE